MSEKYRTKAKLNPSPSHKRKLLGKKSVKKILGAFMPFSDPHFSDLFTQYVELMKGRANIPGEQVESLLRELLKLYWINLKILKNTYGNPDQPFDEFKGLAPETIKKLTKFRGRKVHYWLHGLESYGFLEYTKLRKNKSRYAMDVNKVLASYLEGRQNRKNRITGDTGPVAFMIMMYNQDGLIFELAKSEALWNAASDEEKEGQVTKDIRKIYSDEDIHSMFTNAELRILFTAKELLAMYKAEGLLRIFGTELKTMFDEDELMGMYSPLEIKEIYRSRPKRY